MKEIIDNPDGSANVIFEMGWEEFTKEKFNVFIIQALEDMIAREAANSDVSLTSAEQP